MSDDPLPTGALTEAMGLIAFERAVGGRYRYARTPAAAAMPSEPALPLAEAPAQAAVPTSEPPAAPAGASPYARIGAMVPADSPLRAMGTVAEIGEWLERTVLVPIDETRTKSVLGDGSFEADIMVIGEAPGADEDRAGIPFVGRAGQLLTQILQAVQFERQDVYITNIIKSRPPGNRDPLPEEVAAHIPILYRQIELIRPRLILAVGKTAANSLLGSQRSMAAMRGTFHDFHGIPLMVTYHPAALLRNPQWKRPTWDDVRMLRSRYDELAASDNG
jgi:DNA polymerase